MAAAIMVVATAAACYAHDNDTISIAAANEAVAIGRAPAQGVRMPQGTDKVVISRSGLLQGMRMGGGADAIKTLAMLPGISSGSDYASGVTIDGADYSQTSYSIDGTPILFPFHFGGVFSVFNTPHMHSVTLNRHCRPATAPLRLGGHIEATTTEEIPQQFGGTIDAGMLASSLTLKAPMGKKAGLAISARRSYINAIYSHLLKTGEQDTQYDLTDCNLTLNATPTERDRLKVSAFANFDRLHFYDVGYMIDTRLDWQNMAAQATWSHSSDAISHTTRIYGTHFKGTLNLGMSQIGVDAPSTTTQVGASTEWQLPHNLTLAAEGKWSRFAPQHVTTSGISSTGAHHYVLNAAEVSASAAWHTELKPGLDLRTMLRGGIWNCAGATYPIAAPELGLRWRIGRHNIGVTLSAASQAMHQVGFTDIGMASNFWLPSTRQIKPQYSAGGSLEYSTSLFSGILMPTVSAFLHRVWNQAEYSASVLSILAQNYSPMQAITQANGFNTGVDLTLKYAAGAVNGWAGYSLAICRRRFPEAPNRLLPAANEPMHSAKFMVNWQISRPVTFTAYFTLASGRRYTPTRALYYMAGNAIAVYAERNSAMFPTYHRLDLSATWHLPIFRIASRPVTSFLNLSVMNAYGHNNVEMRYFAFASETNTFRLVERSSLFTFLPSLSYTLEF